MSFRRVFARVLQRLRSLPGAVALAVLVAVIRWYQQRNNNNALRNNNSHGAGVHSSAHPDLFTKYPKHPLPKVPVETKCLLAAVKGPFDRSFPDTTPHLEVAPIYRTLLEQSSVYVIQDAEECERVFASVVSRERENKCVVAGFDCEWRPPAGLMRKHNIPVPLLRANNNNNNSNNNRINGNAGTTPGKTKRKHKANRVAVVQISLNRATYVLQIGNMLAPPPSLAAFLADTQVFKVGVGCLEDGRKLAAEWNCKVAGCVELCNVLARAPVDTDVVLSQGIGLSAIVHTLLGVRMVKDPQVRFGDWEAEVLSLRQVLYAASDAHFAREVFVKLFKLRQKTRPHLKWSPSRVRNWVQGLVGAKVRLAPPQAVNGDINDTSQPGEAANSGALKTPPTTTAAAAPSVQSSTPRKFLERPKSGKFSRGKYKDDIWSDSILVDKLLLAEHIETERTLWANSVLPRGVECVTAGDGVVCVEGTGEDAVVTAGTVEIRCSSQRYEQQEAEGKTAPETTDAASTTAANTAAATSDTEKTTLPPTTATAPPTETTSPPACALSSMSPLVTNVPSLGHFSPLRVVDDDFTTTWQPSPVVDPEVSAHWLQFTFPAPVVVEGYTLHAPPVHNCRAQMPRSWQLQGRLTPSSTWIVLHTVQDEPYWQYPAGIRANTMPGEHRHYSFNPPLQANWQWLLKDTWKDYTLEGCVKLNRVCADPKHPRQFDYTTSVPNVRIYAVDLDKMEQTRVKTGMTRKIRRVPSFAEEARLKAEAEAEAKARGDDAEASETALLEGAFQSYRLCFYSHAGLIPRQEEEGAATSDNTSGATSSATSGAKESASDITAATDDATSTNTNGMSYRALRALKRHENARKRKPKPFKLALASVRLLARVEREGETVTARSW